VPAGGEAVPGARRGGGDQRGVAAESAVKVLMARWNAMR